MNVIRNNGYINLNDYFFNMYGINIGNVNDLKPYISLEQIGNRNKFWFNFDGNRVMFKEQYSGTMESYAELIVSEMLTEMNIPHLIPADYDLALISYDGVERLGVITKDFKKNNCHYCTGSDIIVEVYNRYFKNNSELQRELGIEGLNEIDTLNKLNNFEDIWFILSLYFEKYSNKDEIIANIMDSLVSLYMFDVLTIQGDRHSDNWSLEFDEYGNVRLTPIYDNSNIISFNRRKIFELMVSNFQAYEKMNRIKRPRLLKRMLGQIYHPSTLLTVEPRDISFKKNCLDVLSDFILISDSSYRERFLKIILFIKNNGMSNVYSEVEKKIGHSIPDKVKYYIDQMLAIHIKQIEEKFDIENWNVKGAVL